MSVTVSFDPSGTRAAVVFSEKPGNVITDDLVRALRATLVDLAEDRHVRLVTLEGAGSDFSFGASVPEHQAEQIVRVLPEMHALIVDLLELPAPTAAIVRGRCLGGGFEIALACDVIFAADTATLGLPEIALGVFPPAACVLLPRRVGSARASAAILDGALRRAADWQRAGLIEHVTPANDLPKAVSEWFDRTLARHSAAALRHATRALRASIVDVVSRELPALERLYLTELMHTHDASEGIRAFLEKRPPQWKDR